MPAPKRRLFMVYLGLVGFNHWLAHGRRNGLIIHAQRNRFFRNSLANKPAATPPKIDAAVKIDQGSMPK